MVRNQLKSNLSLIEVKHDPKKHGVWAEVVFLPL